MKITVVKRLAIKDLIDAYRTPVESAEEAGAPLECTLFQDGQEFLSKGMQMPEGFCSWAWADIQRDVIVLSLGGNFPWVKDEGVGLSCCTDAFRPVIFKLERL